MTFSINNICIGCLVCRLYDDAMPKTAQAFCNFAITWEVTFMKSGLIFNDKQQLFLGEALNWVEGLWSLSLSVYGAGYSYSVTDDVDVVLIIRNKDATLWLEATSVMEKSRWHKRLLVDVSWKFEVLQECYAVIQWVSFKLYQYFHM